MPLPDAPDYSKRIYELLKETDLENLTYSQFQGVAEKLFIEPENEDEMRRLILIQMARTAVRGDWDGFLTGGGGSGAPTDAEYVVMALNGTLTDERVLTAGSRITITDGGAGGNVTIAADASPVTSLVAGSNITLSPVSGLGDVTITAASGGTIGGSISTGHVAVGSGTDTIGGSASLAFVSSILNVQNQIELSSAGAAGILKNSQTNQDLRLQVSGTGNVRVENQVTNTDSQLNVKGNGSGTPSISLSNDTKAVSLQCDENQKLKVKGGTDSFVFDVSSSSSGITFPDGSTQTTAASGGGTSKYSPVMPATDIDSGNHKLYLVSKMGIWGNRGSGTGSFNGTSQPYYFPFLSPKTGNIDHISINVSSDGTGVYGFAIYSDNEGVPDSQIGGSMSYTGGTGGTGREDLTPASTIALSQGVQYWIGVVETTSGNTGLTAESNSDVCQVGPISANTSNLATINQAGSLVQGTASSALPSSVTASDLQVNFQGSIRWGIVYA
jgi:hypothetical protein